MEKAKVKKLRRVEDYDEVENLEIETSFLKLGTKAIKSLIFWRLL